MTDTFSPAVLKKRRNAKGLQLSSKSLAPPSTIRNDGGGGGGGNDSATNSHHGLATSNHVSTGHGGMIHDALSEYINMNQATPTVASATRGDLPAAAPAADEEEKVSTPTQASLANPIGVPASAAGAGKSRISRKKPIDLDISRSLGVRKAPLHPGVGGATDELGERLEGMRVGEGNIPATTSSSSSTGTPKLSTTRPHPPVQPQKRKNQPPPRTDQKHRTD